MYTTSIDSSMLCHVYTTSNLPHAFLPDMVASTTVSSDNSCSSASVRRVSLGWCGVRLSSGLPCSSPGIDEINIIIIPVKQHTLFVSSIITLVSSTHTLVSSTHTLVSSTHTLVSSIYTLVSSTHTLVSSTHTLLSSIHLVSSTHVAE